MFSSLFTSMIRSVFRRQDHPVASSSDRRNERAREKLRNPEKAPSRASHATENLNFRERYDVGDDEVRASDSINQSNLHSDGSSDFSKTDERESEVLKYPDVPSMKPRRPPSQAVSKKGVAAGGRTQKKASKAARRK